MKKVLKKLLLAFLLIILVLIVWNWSLILYGIRQGIGQLNVVWKARPVSEILEDKSTPDTLRQKLLLIEEVRKFAIDSLGLKDMNNYKSLFDQQGKEIMWVVTACEPYRFAAKSWEFPILGSVPYKGYFNIDLAKEEKQKLEADGWDVNVTNPSGWSTLGWFNDPILSDMLYKNEGDLASLIIHEMVHATIFVKDSVNFNENLASFIGDLAALKFVLYKYGMNSEEHITFVNEDTDFRKYNDHMLRGADLLENVYSNNADKPEAEKKERKEQLMKSIVANMDTLSLYFNKQPSKRYLKKLPNNAIFMSFRRYMAQQLDLSNMYKDQFQSDFKKMVDYFKE